MEFIRRHGENYNFLANKESGVTFRWGRTPKEDPMLAPWPELVDISISNHCTKNCSFCYRNSSENFEFMSINDYEYLLKSLKHNEWGNVFQVALGGGEPLEHPDFFDIIEITNKFGIVANFTTNGVHLNAKIAKRLKNRVGAIAVSCSNIENLKESNINFLLNENIKTNIHFLLSRSSIKQGIKILEGEYDTVLNGINSVIFLTHKATGRADAKDCLIMDDDLRKFLKLIDKNNFAIRIGFDACFVPMLLHETNINVNYVDSCECAYFSVYVDEKLNVSPCSFSNNTGDAFSLRKYSFSDIWNKKFNKYRKSNINNCKNSCQNKVNCRGGCPYYKELNLCYKD